MPRSPRVRGAVGKRREEQQRLALLRLHRQVEHVEARGAALQKKQPVHSSTWVSRQDSLDAALHR